MIKVTVVPSERQNIYGLMVKKELSLRKNNRGTLHRFGPKKRDEEKWVHSSYNGWIRFQKCIGGLVVALVQSKSPDDEWQLLNSFIGFMDRHFRPEIQSMTISYEPITE